MVDVVLVGASCEANGHPVSCQEPVPGSVDSTSNCIVSVNGTDVATIDTADMNFGSHAHDYTDIDDDDVAECTNYQSHTLDPDSSEASQILSINGSQAYLPGSGVTTDPGSGGSVDITSDGSNDILAES